MKLTLPMPPSLNDYWKRWRGAIHVSPEGKAYRQSVKLRALTAGLRPIEGEVCLVAALFMARKSDVDNRMKCLLDSLQGVAFQNDIQVRELHVYRYRDPANPRVELTVEAAP